MDDPRILIAGGGTGGHLYPAVAIGEALQLRNPRINIHYVGSTFGIEADVLPVKSLSHTLIPIRGLQRSISLDAVGKNLILPFRYLRASRRTKILFQEFNPHAVVGTGGKHGPRGHVAQSDGRHFRAGPAGQRFLDVQRQGAIWGCRIIGHPSRPSKMPTFLIIASWFALSCHFAVFFI